MLKKKYLHTNVLKIGFTNQLKWKQMLVEGFKMSIQMHGLKYTRLIGDGDSSVTNALRDNMPYGLNTHIRKIECINHLLRNYTNKLRKTARKTDNRVGSVPAKLRKNL